METSIGLSGQKGLTRESCPTSRRPIQFSHRCFDEERDVISKIDGRRRLQLFANGLKPVFKFRFIGCQAGQVDVTCGAGAWTITKFHSITTLEQPGRIGQHKKPGQKAFDDELEAKGVEWRAPLRSV